jgi:hypothetical protein
MKAMKLDWSGRPVGRPTTDTLTDRYVWAVLKGLPDSKRADIDRELRASVADELDARIEAGETPDAAERAVLTDLGAPSTLAASYMGRRPGLIGPDLYPGYIGLLKMLYAVVLPITVAVHLVVQAFAGTPVGGIIGGTVALALGLTVHLGFWTTLIFAIAERTGTSMKGVPHLDDGPFDPAKLPSIPTDNGASRADLVASLVFLVLIPIAVVWQFVAPPLRDATGEVIPILHDTITPFWLVYFLVLTVFTALRAIAVYRRGRWTWGLVAVDAVIAVAATVPLIWLLVNGLLINPAFLDALGWADAVGPGSIATTVTSIVLGAVAVWAIGDAAWKTVKADRLGARS